MHPNTLEYIQKQYRISPAVAALIAAAEQEVGAQFQRIDDVREYNQYKVLPRCGGGVALRLSARPRAMAMTIWAGTLWTGCSHGLWELRTRWCALSSPRAPMPLP